MACSELGASPAMYRRNTTTVENLESPDFIFGRRVMSRGLWMQFRYL